MTHVKNAPRTATTLKIRSKSEHWISHSKDPYLELMLRLFQDERTARRGRDFLNMVEERQLKGEPLKTRDWKRIMEELEISRSAFYFMRNKLLGGGTDRHQVRGVQALRHVQPGPRGHVPMVVDGGHEERSRESLNFYNFRAILKVRGLQSDPPSSSRSWSRSCRCPCTPAPPRRMDIRSCSRSPRRRRSGHSR